MEIKSELYGIREMLQEMERNHKIVAPVYQVNDTESDFNKKFTFPIDNLPQLNNFNEAISKDVRYKFYLVTTFVLFIGFLFR